MSHLTPHQRKMWRQHGFVYVTSRGGDHYALADGWNVYRLNDRGLPQTLHQIGATSPGGGHVPRPDSILAQMLLLEADPDLFHRIACRARAERAHTPIEIWEAKHFREFLRGEERKERGERRAGTEAAWLYRAFWQLRRRA